MQPTQVFKIMPNTMAQLKTCVNHLIEQYEALLSYFRSTEDKQAVMRKVKIVLEKPLTKTYLLSLCSALPIVNFNRDMQQQSPILHVLYQERDVYENFCCSSRILSTCVLLNNSEEYLPLHEVFKGHNTLSYLEEENGLSSAVENLGRLSKLGGLLQPRELSNET